jgi:hypothetical protein
MHSEEPEPITDETIHRDLRSALAIDCSPEFSARVHSRLRHETAGSRNKRLFGFILCACVIAVALAFGHRQQSASSQHTVAVETPRSTSTAPQLWQASAQVPLQRQSATIVTGADIGFRVDATKTGVALGRLVVRVNGQWLDAQFSDYMRVIPIREK